MLNPVMNMVKEKVAEAAAPAVTELTTKAADIFRPAIAQSPSRHGAVGRYYQIGIYEAREGFAPRLNFSSEHEEADYLGGFNAEREKMRAESERRDMRGSWFSLLSVFGGAFFIGVALYGGYRLWPRSAYRLPKPRTGYRMLPKKSPGYRMLPKPRSAERKGS